MANVMFKRGLQASIPRNGSAQDGVFYLTTDTNRLYVGMSDKSCVLLNQTVNFVDSLSSLQTMSTAWNTDQKAAHINDLYYITGANILAVWTGEQQGWIQINPDTNTTNAEVSVESSTTGGNRIVVTVKDSAQNSQSGSMPISASNGITLGFENKGLQISGDTYDMSAQAVTGGVELDLNSAKQTDSAVKILGSSNVTVEMDNSDVKISAKDTYNVDTDVSLDSAGQISVTVTDSNGDTATGTSSPISIGYGKNSSSSAVLGSALDVYTTSEVDNLINGLNGMTFKGTVGDAAGVGSSSLPTSGVSVGDVYMVSGHLEVTSSLVADGNMPEGNTAQSGDLFVATGTEGNNGVISSGLKWHYVPSGDDLTNTIYHTVVNAANMLFDVQDDSNSSIGSIKIANGTAMAATGSVSGKDLTVTVNHGNVTCTPTTETAESDKTSITAITGITVNGQGHVTGYKTKTVGVKTYTLQDAVVSASNDNANVSIQLKDGVGTPQGTADFNITSGSLKVTASSDSVAINLEWGTF